MNGTRWVARAGSRQEGVSLVEALIALGIVASLLLMTIPLMSGANEDTAEASTYLAMLDELARQMSRTSGQTHWVVRDRSGSRELVLSLPAGGDARIPTEVGGQGEESR